MVMNTASDHAARSFTRRHRPEPRFARRQRRTSTRETITKAQPERLGVTGRHGLVGFAGSGVIKRGVLMAAPGTGEDRNTGQRTKESVPRFPAHRGPMEKRPDFRKHVALTPSRIQWWRSQNGHSMLTMRVPSASVRRWRICAIFIGTP
jgi:hypothetical protein